MYLHVFIWSGAPASSGTGRNLLSLAEKGFFFCLFLFWSSVDFVLELESTGRYLEILAVITVADR